MDHGLLPRQAFPTLPGFADLTWPDSCSFTESLVDNCNSKFTNVPEPTCINYVGDAGCCSSWGSYGSSYLSCLQTEYSSCPGLFPTFVSEVQSQLPCATDFPLASVPSLVLESISTGPPPAPTPHTTVPPYTGSGNLLQQYCVTPEYVLLDGPTALWAPIVGCVGGKTDCCPYSVFEDTKTIAVSTVTAIYTVTVDIGPGGTTQGGYAGFQPYPTPISANLSTLAHCPNDYQTVSGGCCPSGYQLWNAVLGGQVPCYSSLNTNSFLVPPAVPVTSETPAFGTFMPTTSQIPTSAIVNIIFAIQYNVIPSNSTSLSTGAKAGIGVGASIAGITIVALALALVWRTRKHKKDKNTLATIQATRSDGPNQSEIASKTPMVYSTRTELHSDDANLPAHNAGIMNEPQGYYPQQEQQWVQTQQGVPTARYPLPQQEQYVQQMRAEQSLQHQNPPTNVEGYGFQTGYAAVRNPGDHFSSTESAPHGHQAYGYKPNYSTA